MVARPHIADCRHADLLISLEEALRADGVHDVILEIAGASQMKGDVCVQIEQSRGDPLPLRGNARRADRHVCRVAHRANAVVVDQDAAVRPWWRAGSVDQRPALDEESRVGRPGYPNPG